MGESQRLLLRARSRRPASSCSGKPFVKVNWASGFDEGGRPIQTPQPPGMPTYPGNQGGTNWYSPSLQPAHRLFYVSAWEDYASIYRERAGRYEAGRNFIGGGIRDARRRCRTRRRCRHRLPRPDQHTGPTPSATAR